MTRIFIDTNVLLYNQNRESPFYELAHEIIRSLAIKDLVGVLTPYVLNEVHYLFFKKFGYLRVQVLMKQILAMPHMDFVDFKFTVQDMKSILKLAEEYKLKTFDAYHAYYCKKLRIGRIATFDKDFVKLPWVKVYQLKSGLK